MASTITSIDTQIAGLAQSFQTAIKATITAESAPLKQTQALKDTVDLRRSIYTDVKNNIDSLHGAIQAMISTHANYGMALVSKATVTPGTTGATVLTAVTTSDTAPVADYDINVTKLARAHSKSSSISASSADVALGLSGTFWLGGTGIASASMTPTSTVVAYTTYAPATDQKELGTGNYTVETRDSNGTRQFRLVDADGKAVSILNQDGVSYTTDWQNLTDGSYNTGRGLGFTLSSTGTLGSTAISYTAAGTSITIGASDTMRTIASAINAASQPVGRDFKASIVANKLVLTGSQSGANHSLLYSDPSNLLGLSDLQTAQNAEFTVNGMLITRASNSGLTDVIDGVTLNLASDAEGKSARLSVGATTDKSTGLMNQVVGFFNKATEHLKDKLTATSSTKDGKTTYTRGPVSGDLSLRGLRAELLSMMNNSYTNTGSFRTFEDIGLSLDKDMKLSVDTTKFSEALKNNPTDVTALLDAGFGTINTMLTGFAGSTGSLATTIASFDEQSTNYDVRITRYNDSITKRKEVLYNQYLLYQNQIADYGRTAQWFGILTNTTGTNTNKSA